MAKKIDGYIKLQIPAGKANPSPPVGTALGPRGLNIMEFCKQFNAATQSLEPGMPIPVVITCFSDRSFNFVTKTPGREGAGKVIRSQIREIAEKKMVDLNAHDVEAAMKMIAGSTRSMGLDVVEG